MLAALGILVGVLIGVVGGYWAEYCGRKAAKNGWSYSGGLFLALLPIPLFILAVLLILWGSK